MNLLKQYPRFVTFLLLIMAFVYTTLFFSSIGRKINELNEFHNTRSIQINESKLEDNSFTGSMNKTVNSISERIEQAIRQTSHLIGS